MTGKLTTHVLDISIGRPAREVLVELWQVGLHEELVFLVKRVTNLDGRVHEPFLEGEKMKPGIYEFRFHVGAYYRTQRTAGKHPPFLDCVPVRFSITEPDSHYHVPLLVSPGGYSTYRGS
ncbi:hydroxyisourate hydrolase [Ammoniphilus sp. YIM 78166]|uniref:hydroxyisourate hydrolase n=1 Tax=Ammoniphilus sp. YIM 78166 TaxID=1644106 RepID=UPI00106FC1B1|nr:hydroxyisourate hydrolase [Ammoniphilus sp. YIM 78166]